MTDAGRTDAASGRDRLRLRVHVSEPFDFERENDSADLFGSTGDDAAGADEWVVDLDGWFTFNERDYDAVLVAPRYVGEHLGTVHDAILGVPVRIAHRTSGGWHYALAGLISIAPAARDETDGDGASDGDNRGD